MKRKGPRALLRALRRDEGGVSIIEFAFAFPVLILILMGCLDLGQTLYVTALLQGSVEEVARDATLETADTDELDAYVEEVLSGIAPGASATFTRKSYYDFEDVGRAEAWNDSNNDGTCDDGETYTDENDNGSWDSDVGVSGNGGADDSVLYTVTVTFPPLFPVPFVSWGNDEKTLSATAFKKNQPYATQDDYGSSAGSCS